MCRSGTALAVARKSHTPNHLRVTRRQLGGTGGGRRLLLRHVRQVLGQPAAALAQALGVGVRLLPATDDRLRTKLSTPAGELDFQEWFVARRHQDPVSGVRFEGADAARPAPGVSEALAGAELVVIAPSNPFVSIDPILAVPGIRDALAGRRVAAISPLVGGKAFRGPLAEMLKTLGHEPTAASVAGLYAGLADTFVVAPGDEGPPGSVVCDIDMVDPARRAEVGGRLLETLL